MPQDNAGQFRYTSALKVESPTHPDSQPVESRISDIEAFSHSETSARVADDFQRLCKGIWVLGDMKPCMVINYHGTVLAQMLGELPEDRELATKGGSIAAVMWGGLKNYEPFAGQLGFVSAVFEKRKFVVIPFPEVRIAAIMIADVDTDSFRLKEMVSDYVRSWSQRT